MLMYGYSLMSGNSASLLIQSIENFTSSLLAGSAPVSQSAGAILITAIWQGAVVASCLAICLKLTSRISAALRFTVWSAGFLAVAALPFLPLLAHAISSPSFGTAGDIPSLAQHPWLTLDLRWSIALTVLWAAVSLYRLGDLALHSARLRSLWKTAKPVTTSGDLPLTTPKLWGRKPIQICTTEALDRPSVIGFFAPRILIPEWLFARLTPGELEQIVLHETEHLRRADDWTNLLQKLSLVLFPLNPVLLWMERKLCLEREMACDEAVIRITRAPRAYAACLTSLAERGIQQRADALSLGAWQRRPELVQRVHSILRRRRMLAPVGARTVVAVLACGLAGGSVELARCPQLVAFTPAQPMQLAGTQAAEANNLPMQAKMIYTAFVQKPRTAWIHQSSPHQPSLNQPRMIELKATLPAHAQSWPAPRIGQRQMNVTSVARRIAAQPSLRGPAPGTPKEELLKAEANDPAAVPVQEEQAQSWIVLTTWEETTAPSVNQTEADATTPIVPATDRAPVQPSRQLTVTQLVFRVVPASFVTTSPTAVPAIPVRGGWLVLQL